jgi:hypothetical protein
MIYAEGCLAGSPISAPARFTQRLRAGLQLP